MGLTWNSHIHVYHDLDFLKDAIASLPENITKYVIDGRYCLFDPGADGLDWSPEVRDYCRGQANIEYILPPESLLPFGHSFDVPDKYRPGNHAKAKYAFREVLPEDEWTLKLDADERLETFDVDPWKLDEEVRYGPLLKRGQAARDGHVARFFKPKYWTPWIDDCLLPRALFPRDSTPLEVRYTFWRVDDFRAMRHLRLSCISDIVVDNRDEERCEERQERRIRHLRRIGRGERAGELDEL